MRPLELRLKGFRSYREATVLDWRGRHLVGIVGPIGAGKSSILDAVAFALYGKTPTFERDTKALINQTATECHVELRFEVDGQVWRAARGLRRKGASGHQLQRLDGDRPDAEVVEPISGERPVRERVEQLLGMDFAAFCRSVLLAQNRFADFLKATPRDRNEVLKGVFGYERFDEALEAARRRVKAAEVVLGALSSEATQLAAARGQLDAADERARLGRQRATAIEAAREPFETASAAADEARRGAAAAAERAEEVRGIAEALPSPGSIGQAAELARVSTDAVVAAIAALEHAEAAHADAEARREAVAERVGDQDAFVAFAALVTQHEHLVATAQAAAGAQGRAVSAAEEATAAVARAGSADAAAADEAAGATRDHEAAVEDTAEAERALHEARHADMARSLRAELVADDPCPVCEQPVATIPRAGRAPAIAGAERAVARARKLEATAFAARQTASAAAAAAEERVASARTRADELAVDAARAEEALRSADADLAAAQSELVDRLGEGDPRALLDERRRELEAATAAVDRASAEAADARGALEAARRAGEEGRDGLVSLASQLTSAWGLLRQTRAVAPEADAVQAAFVEIGEVVLAADERAAAAAAAAGEAADRAAATIAELFATLGLAPGSDFTMALAEAAAERAAADEQVRALRAAIDAGADIDERLRRTERDRGLAARLVADLQPARFLAFLLEEERAALADLGSVHFEELTGGAYRFTGDDRFEVLDLNAAGTERRADSLSGGETFLASLALALALAEMVARGGGRLDAFFLDEGFGSLDPEHLDRAMDGIGRLVADDPRRLVVLVSHVEQMREMLEDLIVLDKHDLTGDTVVVAGATRG